MAVRCGACLFMFFDYNLNKEQLLNLDKYIEILTKWQKKINLIANSTIENIKQRHVLDSLQLKPYLEKYYHKNDKNNLCVADLGSGGGFPALVLAITCNFCNFYLVESDTRKCAFLSEVCRSLQLKNVTVVNERIEKASNLHGKMDIVISRALAKTIDLINFSYPLVKKNNALYFLKGKSHNLELEQLYSSNLKGSVVLEDKKKSVSSDDGVVLRFKILKD